MDRIEKLKEFLITTPADSFLQHALALEYIKIGDDVTAQKLFEEILNREPDYIGSYYHLGQLLERIGEPKLALDVYTSGMKVAKKLGDNHAYNELQGVYDDLQDY